MKDKPGVKRWGTSWTQSLEYLCKPTAMTELANGYRYYINRFVPKKTGELRKTGTAKGWARNGTGDARVIWTSNAVTENYFHYQYEGDVYGPNKAVFEGDTHVGWRSPTAHGKWTKRNMGWKMGKPGSYTLKDGRVVTIHGYTTPDTRWKWDEAFHEDEGDFGEKAVNIRAGRFMYERFVVEMRKNKNPIRLYGGLQVYHSWRQIKNIRT